jgi:hypothetical protein
VDAHRVKHNDTKRRRPAIRQRSAEAYRSRRTSRTTFFPFSGASEQAADQSRGVDGAEHRLPPAAFTEFPFQLLPEGGVVTKPLRFGKHLIYQL